MKIMFFIVTLLISNISYAESLQTNNKAARNKAAATKCMNSSTQDTGNPQVDTGCSMVAFDVCVYNATGETGYVHEAKSECAILHQSFGDNVCKKPCNDASRLR